MRSGQLIDGAMGSCGSGWTEDQVYVCGTLLQAASFPGFLLGGHLVDKLGVSAARVLAGVWVAFFQRFQRWSCGQDRHRLIVNARPTLATLRVSPGVLRG